ncbi:4-alpha-glucanotransferase [Qiania dongpingensis]|uniref:4-alpha-glucanotransferase n=1 Tax=Qiania dongpingensis TaxID=2763669 RepID=A0A7G9G1N4_9FIRM|nr:4-alpha-glucanotransferase [Qiania dongpingensis]QNM04716.1 4-alpha-glucanotransferase [Qiania dongpingensis]
MMTGQVLERGAGILLPVSGLPSPYGIGTFGRAAYDFIDFLKRAGQKYWQVLPVGPTSYGDSPYQSFSAFAGNPYFVDLDFLTEEGLLQRDYVESFSWGDQESYVSYETVYRNRFQVLRTAAKNSRHREQPDFQAFEQKNAYWLRDYCLFMACKEYFGGIEWLKWEEDIRFRRPEAVEKYEKLLEEDMDFWAFCQYKFFCQWKKLREYAAERGIRIIGDIPIYAAMDSADVWTHPGLFQLDENLMPKFIAGVPPDAFSDTGQLWGNPLYDWDAMEKEDFEWWRRRVLSSQELYDAVRIDHFIGITRYYAVPGGAKDSVHGTYMDGPGKKLTDVINETAENLYIIAEDLGIVTPAVRKLLEDNHYPGMKVIAFGFDGNPANEHLPHNYKETNCIAYGGTHDNETLAGLFCDKSDEVLGYLFDLIGTRDREKIVEELFRLAYGSVANVVIFQAQDVLKLDNSARMNFPSTLGNNWKWRLRKGQLGQRESDWLGHLVHVYNRY